MNERKQNFTDHSSAMILISLVVMSLLANSFFKDLMVNDNPMGEIRFPAYATENEDVNRAMPFVMNITLPDGWEIKDSGTTENWPDLALYNPYYIYNGDEQIGYIAFNVFTPPAEDTDDISYHQSVWPVMDKGSMQLNNYTLVRLTDTFEASFCQLSDNVKTADAVVCYNKDLKNMAAVVLTEGVADQQTLTAVCLSLSFSAQ